MEWERLNLGKLLHLERSANFERINTMAMNINPWSCDYTGLQLIKVLTSMRGLKPAFTLKNMPNAKKKFKAECSDEYRPYVKAELSEHKSTYGKPLYKLTLSYKPL